MKKQTCKIYCNRCKREIDWELQEELKAMSKEDLIKIINGLRQEEN